MEVLGGGHCRMSEMTLHAPGSRILRREGGEGEGGKHRCLRAVGEFPLRLSTHLNFPDATPGTNPPDLLDAHGWRGRSGVWGYNPV